MRSKLLILAAVVIFLLAIVQGWALYSRQLHEKQLEARAHAYWEALRLNDLQTAYRMETETATGHLLPHEVEVRRGFGMKVGSYTLSNIAVNGPTATLDVAVMLTMADFQGKTFPGGTLKDQWSLIDGVWYHGSTQPGSALIRRKGTMATPPLAVPIDDKTGQPKSDIVIKK